MATKNYSTTSSSNTSVNGVSSAEGMAPSQLNNLARELIKDSRDTWNDKEYFILGDGDGATVFTRASSTSVTVPTNITSTHHVGRRVKIVGSSTTIYGKIASSNFSSPNTTITFTFDSGSISGSDSTVDVYVGSTFTNPATPVIDEDNFSSNSAILPPSQQSVKTYVDALVTAQDLDVSDGSSSIAIDLDSETLGLIGGTGIDSTASGNNVTFAIDSTVATKTGTQTLTNKTINGSNNTLSNIGNSSLSNSSVSYGGVSLALGATDATPAFDLQDATSYPASALTGTVANNQVATGIDAIKIADGSVTNAEFQYINTLSSNAQTQLDAKVAKASNLSDLASASTARTNLGLGTMAVQNSATVSISGGSITGLSTPSNNSDVAIKSYVDDAVAGLRTRTIAEVATTANVNLSNGLEAGDTIDGVTLVAGDRVLVKDQSTATENGLYIAVSSGSASRDPEHDTIAELSGGMVVVNQGSTNDNKIFLCTTDNDGSLDSTNINYVQVTPSNTGTVTSIGVTQSGSEFSISGSPVTSAGNITLDVNRISATKIGANTNVSDTEFGYLANVSSDIQTQIDAKAGAGFAVAMAIAL